MFNDIDWTRQGNNEICISNSEKSRNTRKDPRKDTGRSSVLEMKRSGMELFLIQLKVNGILEPLKWLNDSKKQVIQCSGVSMLRVLDSEKEGWQRHHTLQCGCFRHRALIPNYSFCKSAQSAFTEQFRNGVNYSV